MAGAGEGNWKGMGNERERRVRNQNRRGYCTPQAEQRYADLTTRVEAAQHREDLYLFASWDIVKCCIKIGFLLYKTMHRRGLKRS
jgi:hypothetical protein